MNRLLSRREKDGNPHRRQKSRDKSSEKKARPISSDGIMSLFKPDSQKKLDKEQNQKIQTIKQRLNDEGYTTIEESQITYALLSKHADGDVDRAFEMVVLFQQSVEGVIKPYDSTIHMLGAENRENVTCYLDALLFAMFARLTSFEFMLYMQFDDEPRRRLSTLIRLWVNMLRTGKLIQTDITTHLQDAMAACGWKDAAKLEQQDTSEAFSFLTETLELPLLTLKMDIYHDGAEDATDDHKLIHERLLEVAVPEEPGNGKHIQLEDCLESYFNNRISVTRKLERSNTKSSVRSGRSSSVDKGGSQHIEVSEISWSNPGTPTSTHAPRTPLTPSGGRTRTDSIIRHRVIEEIQEEAKADSPVDSNAMSAGNVKRKSSIRKEVMMPAWQFFNLIPWYTNPPKPVNDAVVATHFSKKRPVLGICLKRYGMSADGKAFRKNTFIDIPVDVRLPHFVDEDMNDQIGEPLMGNFKLSLVAVICHRGSSVNAGHYISFIRGITQIADGDSASSRRMSSSSRPPEYPVDQWIKHDDLSEPERVTKIDNIEEALKDEMPYLLFYQVLPTYEMTPASGDLDHEPPLYEHETGIDVRIEESSPISERKPADEQPQSYFDGIREGSVPAPSIRFSAELERPRHSINVPERRASVAVTESSLASAASSVRMSEPASVPSVPPIPATPPEETTAQRLSRAASRFKSSSKSRPTSSSGENRESRFSATFSRMAQRSKEQLNKTEGSKTPIPISTHDGASETRDSAIVIDDTALKPGDESPPKRSKSIRGRKRDKSKDPTALKVDVVENEAHHHHGHRVKGSKDMPDRQCKIM